MNPGHHYRKLLLMGLGSYLLALSSEIHHQSQSAGGNTSMSCNFYCTDPVSCPQQTVCQNHPLHMKERACTSVQKRKKPSMQLKRDPGWRRLSTGKAGERFKLVSFTGKLLRQVLNFFCLSTQGLRLGERQTSMVVYCGG